LITGTDTGLVVGRVNPVFIEGRQSLPLVEAPVARELGLTDGQVVLATVQSRGEQLGLLLRGRLIEVPPRQDWQVGQALSFRVQVNTDGSLTLHPLATAAPPEALPPLVDLTPKPVVSRIGNLLFRPPGTPDTQSLFRPGAMDALLVTVARPDLQAQWNAMRLTTAGLTPDLIRQALIGAMGSEAGLVKGQRPTASDPKQMFHNLLLALVQSNTASEDTVSAREQIKRAIDEVESAQVHAVQTQSQGAMMFSLVLPFKDAEPVELSFERSPAAQDQLQLLTVNVHSQSREFGELWLKTELHGQHQVELVMWAARASIAEQAQKLSAALGLELQGAGLSMRSFQVIHGARPAPPVEQAPTESGLILDVTV
jgi:hypothetical protein